MLTIQLTAFQAITAMGIGAYGGAKVGAAAGTLVAPGVGTVVVGFTGAVFGAAKGLIGAIVLNQAEQAWDRR